MNLKAMEFKPIKSNPKHDAVVYWVITEFCNFSCTYCIANLKGRYCMYSPNEGDFEYYEEKKACMRPDVDKLISTLDETGKTFKFLISGGEPFLIDNAVELYTALSQKHYMGFHSNITSPKIPQLLKNIDPSRIVYVHASLHIEELMRHKLLDQYIYNFKLFQEAGVDIEAAIIGHPNALAQADTYRNFFGKHGIEICFDHYIGKANGKVYPAAYTKEELKKIKPIDKSNTEDYRTKGKLCNASYNCLAANFEGKLTPCYYTKNDMGNLFTGIKFNEELLRCPVEKCYDPMFFQEADIYPKLPAKRAVI